MRLRFTVLVSAAAAAALAGTALPAVAGAAPQHNRALTIHAAPLSIIAGEQVLIYGQLEGADHAGQVIRLYHRINPSPVFTLISKTTTNGAGQYEFVRADGIVMTNRNWYVRGPVFSHSRTVHERVAALLSLAASSPTGTTRHPITFSGHVTPGHAGSVVVLQVQNAAGTAWRTLARSVVGSGSNYQFNHAWRAPGAYDVRVLFRGDARNTTAASDPVSVQISQTEVADFTIVTSDPVVTDTTPVTISGVLDQPGTTTPEPSTLVGLYERTPAAGTTFSEVTTATTGTDGSYTFANVVPAHNELYEVRTMAAPRRASAALFQGVQDVLTFQASAQTATVGGQVTFSGTVSPSKAGHVIYLERLGADNAWHVVEQGVVSPMSTFSLPWTFGTAGTKEFRARITGGPANVGAASTPVSVVVSLPPLSALPTS